MLKLLREIVGIGTVGALRQALAEFPDAMPLGDSFGKVEVLENMDTGEQELALC